MSAVERLARATTLLFVPGDRPDRFDRALSSGADCVVVDLEDAVATEAKVTARAHAVDLLAGTRRDGPLLAIRVNDPRTPLGAADLGAVTGRPGPDVVVVPKAEAGSGLTGLVARLGERTAVVALVETAAGLRQLDDVAGSGVARLALGPLDLATELGLDPTQTHRLAPARFDLVTASAAAGLPAPIDGPDTEIRDLDLVASRARESRAAGFGARLCVHPGQVPATTAAFEPTPAEVAWATEVVAAVADRAVAVVAGQMVDRPLLLRAQRILDATHSYRTTPTTCEEP